MPFPILKAAMRRADKLDQLIAKNIHRFRLARGIRRWCRSYETTTSRLRTLEVRRRTLLRLSGD